jgi:hemerythrin superfamily protein
MSDTRLLSANPADLLMQDHDRIRHLFAEHARSEHSETRQQLFRQIRQELGLHGAIEQKYIYPLLKGGLLAIAEDHAAIEGLLEKLSQMNVGEKSYDALMKLLEENFTLHAAVEERDLFPQLERLSPLSRQELTPKLENARSRLGRSPVD